MQTPEPSPRSNRPGQSPVWHLRRWLASPFRPVADDLRRLKIETLAYLILLFGLLLLANDAIFMAQGGSTAALYDDAAAFAVLGAAYVLCRFNRIALSAAAAIAGVTLLVFTSVVDGQAGAVMLIFLAGPLILSTLLLPVLVTLLLTAAYALGLAGLTLFLPSGDRVTVAIGMALFMLVITPVLLFIRYYFNRLGRLHLAGLAGREQQLRTLVDNMPVLIHASDPAGRTVMWNREAERVTGFEAAEVLGQPVARAGLNGSSNGHNSSAAWQMRPAPGDEESRLATRTGGEKVIAWSNPAGQAPIDGWAAWEVGVDVTALRQAETQLRQTESAFGALLADNPLAMWIVDGADFRHLEVNAAALAQYGYSQAEFLALGLQDLAAGGDGPALTEHLKVIPDGLGNAGEWRQRRKDGTSLDVQVYAHRRVFAGRPALLLAAVNVTEQVRLRNAQRRLHDLSLALGQIDDVDPALELILNAIVEVPGAEVAGVYLANPAGNAFDLRANRGLSPDFASRIAHLERGSVQVQRVRAVRSFYGSGPEFLPPDDHLIAQEKLQAMAVVPVLHTGRAVAALGVASRSLTDFPADARDYFESLASQVGGVLARLHAQSALRRSERQAQAVLEALPDVLLVLDCRGLVLDQLVNRASLPQLLPVDLAGKTLPELLLPQAGAALAGAIVRASETGQLQTVPCEWQDSYFEFTLSMYGEQKVLCVVRDRTQQWRGERALDRERWRFENLFENSPVATWLEDLTGIQTWFEGLRAQGVTDLRRYLAAHPGELRAAFGQIQVRDLNRAAVTQNGASDKDQLIHGLVDLLPTVSEADLINELESLWRGETRFEIKTSGSRLDGRPLNAIVRMSVPLRGQTPDYSNVVLTAEDITDRKQAEDLLQKSEERYRLLFEHLQVGLADHAIICDASGKPVDFRFVAVNPAFEQISGKRREQVVGRLVSEVSPDIDPKFIEIYGRVALTGEPVHLEEYVADFGKYLEITAFRPKPGHFAVTFQDVSDRRRSQQALHDSEVRLAGVVNSAMDAMVGLDDSQRIVLFNPAAETMFGYKAAEVLGQHADRLVPDLSRAVQLVHAGQQGAAPAGVQVIRAVRANGQEFPAEVSQSRTTLDDGHLLTLILRDITARSRTEREEREQRQLAEALRATAAAINSTLDFDAVLDKVLANLAWVVPYTAAQVALMEGEQLRAVRAHSESPEYSAAANGPLAEGSLARTVLETRQALVIPDTAGDARWPALPQAGWVRSFIAVPLALRDQPLGLLALQSASAYAFQSKHLEWLAIFADQAAQAISNARLYETLQGLAGNIDVLYQAEAQRAAQAASMSRVLQALNGAGTPSEAFPAVRAGVIAIAGNQFVNIGLIGELTTPPFRLSLFEVNADGTMEESSALAADSAAFEDLFTGKAHFTGDLKHELEHPMESWLYGHGWRSRLALPLYSSQTLVGVLNVGWNAPMPYELQPHPLLIQIANGIALAVEKGRLLAETRDSLVREQRLSDITRTIGSTLDLTGILASLVRQAAKLLGADSGALGLLTADGSALQHAYLYNLPAELSQAATPRGQGLSWQVIFSGQAVVLPDYATYPAALPAWKGTGARAAVAAPIFNGNQCIGVITLFSNHANKQFARRDLELMQSIGRQAGVAIQNAQLFQETRNRARELESLFNLSAKLRSAQTHAEMFRTLLEHLTELLGAQAVSIDLVDLQTGEIVIEQAHGVWADLSGTRLPMNRSLSGRIVETADLYRSDEMPQDGSILRARPETTHIIGAPLIASETVLGALFAGSDRHFADGELRLLAGVADIAANAIRRSSQLDRTRHRADQLAAVNTLSRAMAATFELPSIYDGLYQAVRQLLPGSAAFYISLNDPASNAIQCAYAVVDDEPQDLAEAQACLSAGELPRWQREAVQSGQPVIVDHLLYSDAPDDGSPQSGLFAPMVVKGASIGVVHVQSRQAGAYSESDAEVLSLVANTGAISVENASLVTELQRSIEELRTAQGRLIQAARLSAVGELAAGVAHQINNPLTTIIADAQLLTRTIDAENPAAISASAIYQAGWRAQRVVKRLLNFARPDQGDFKPTALNDTILEALDLIGAHLGRGGAKVELDLSPDLPPLLANGHQLQEVWLNLLMNAHDALSAKRPGLIRVTSRPNPAGGGVVVTVSDNGHGIKEADQANLFTLFFTTKGESRGNGLGLSVCQRIVRSHGGDITFETAAEQGTTFIITLPDRVPPAV